MSEEQLSGIEISMTYSGELAVRGDTPSGEEITIEFSKEKTRAIAEMILRNDKGLLDKILKLLPKNAGEERHG